MYKYTATVVKIIDGDTLDLLIDCGFGISKKIRVRLFGINAPEVFGIKHDSEEHKKGIESTKFVEDWLKGCGDEIIVLTHKDKKGKFGRYLAEIINPKTLAVLNEEIVINGFAESKIYD